MAPASDGLQKTSTQTPLQSQSPRHSLFYTVATLLGVKMFPSPSHSYHPHEETSPPETSRDLLVSRFPYDYYRSLSG